jgi:serine/threonine protein kinase
MRSWWDDAEGTVLDDRYELGERIGRGGAGVVHRAWDRARQRAVAVKLLPAAGAAVDARTGRQEADVLRALDHPQLVALHDVLTTEEGVALVMELVDGPSLVDRLDTGALPLDDAAVVLHDVAAGLAHAHARGIVHRDVKPGNVLLRQVDHRVAGAALADFGIARFAEATRVTTAATILGTIRYLSPEQVRGERATAASDVYSLGLTLVAAVTGRPAFPGSDAESLAGRLVRSPELPEHLPADWAALLGAMTALQPESRPTAAEVAAAAGLLGTASEPLVPIVPIAAAEASAFDEPTRPIDAPALASVAAPRRRRIPRFVALAVSASTAVASLGLVMILTGAPLGFGPAGSAAIDRVDAPSVSASAIPSATGSTSASAPRAATVHEATAIRSSAAATTTASRSAGSTARHTATSSRTTSHSGSAPGARPAPKTAREHVVHRKVAPTHATHRKAAPKESGPKRAAPKPAPHGGGTGGGGHGKH